MQILSGWVDHTTAIPFSSLIFIQALISLQKKGICHRDISLENILINENNEALLIDLGMCLRVPFKSADESRSQLNGLRRLLCLQERCGKPN